VSEFRKGMALRWYKLNQSTGATEFHFSDIYQGINQFKNVSLQNRLAIFRDIVSFLTETINPAIFVQSADNEFLQEVSSQYTLPNFPSPLSMDRPRNFCFVILLCRIMDYIENTRSGTEQAIVCCDQGILQSGYYLRFPMKPGLIHDNTVYFFDSKEQRGIQLADFAAFVLNRQQLLFKKKKLNSLEKTFLLIVEPLAPLFKNVEPREIMIQYDSFFHVPYAIMRMFRGTGRPVIVSDLREGVLLTSGVKFKDKE
jgi:hypothetical protein